MRHTTYTGVKLGDFNIEDKGYLSDALKGYWARKWENNVQLTIVRGHCMLSSPIMTAETIIDIEIPDHKPFYVNIISANSSRRELIETKNIKLILQSGEQLQAVFTVEV